MVEVATSTRVIRFDRSPKPGELGAVMVRFGADVVVGHPTFGNEGTIGALLEQGIIGAPASFGGRRVAFIVSDGTLTESSRDTTTIDAAVAGAQRALDHLSPKEQELVQVIATPYEGYGGDETPGKGSALKLIFDEAGHADVPFLILLDGDLRNDMAQWHRVFAEVDQWHLSHHPHRPMFVTARYARHFVDASLTRFIVGPLTTLMGTYVPGGISGDIALSAEAVAKERDATWTTARRRYGTDISTTFDNLADSETVVYELSLGAKLHDITDEAKLSVMPAQVIGAALDRLLHWQDHDGRVLDLSRSDRPLKRVEIWGPDRTRIGFVDPGQTDVFDIDSKRHSLVQRFDEFESDIETVVGADTLVMLQERVEVLARERGDDESRIRFLGVDQDLWIELLQRAVAFALARKDIETPCRALNYLYTAAFLEFVRARLEDLGARTLGEVRAIQDTLGVPAVKAEQFYTTQVDAVADRLAFEFYERRARIEEWRIQAGAGK